MSSSEIIDSTPRRQLRLWPGVVLASLLFVVRFIVPMVAPGAIFIGVIGGFVGVLLILLWWLFFSRAAWLERLGAIALAAVGMMVTYHFLDISIARGNMGYQIILHGVPALSLALVVWAVASRHLSNLLRRVTMVATILIACGAWTLLRSEGVKSDGMADFTWRWTGTAEDRLLARGADQPRQAVSETPSEVEAQWPGLRGPRRDGIIPGFRIATDWTRSPPVELWRRPIGPGVSSFAVRGNLLFTQEQRGDDEIVAAHDLKTGEPVWRHSDAARFWDPHVGAGPRATPAVAGGRVYTLGATGILNALDADDGSLVWSRDVPSETGAQQPVWGFVSSPLVVDDLLIVQAGAMVAYDLESGEPRWHGPPKRGSYSSPQLLTLAGVPQIVLTAHATSFAVAPADGALLWELAWPGVGIVQPARVGESDLLVSMVDAGAMPIGTRRLAVTKDAEGWKVEERWLSNRLKPSFSDVVVHEGQAYGVDGGLLAAIDLEAGERKWKGGRYGEGQLLLLPDQDLLLVVSEHGELALVEANPDGFKELARIPALAGKTWSQPALIGDILLVRSTEEMAAFRLPPAVP